MNKKGLDYAGLLVAVTIICAVALYVQVAKQTDTSEGLIGGRQTALLQINPETMLYEAYVKRAGEQVLSLVVRDLSIKPELFNMPLAGKCIVLNYAARPQNIIPLDVLSTLKNAFNNRMNEYSKNFEKEVTGWKVPLNNYEIAVEKGQFTAVAVVPTEFAFYGKIGGSDIDVKMGSAVFRPTFEIKYDHKLEEFPIITQVLLSVARECSYKDKPLECATKEAVTLQGWTIGQESNAITFTPPTSAQKPCFALFLPEKNQSQTT